MFNPDYYCVKDSFCSESFLNTEKCSRKSSFLSNKTLEDSGEFLWRDLCKDYTRSLYELKFKRKYRLNYELFIRDFKPSMTMLSSCGDGDSAEILGQVLKQARIYCNEGKGDISEKRKKCDQFNEILERAEKGYESYKKIEKLFKRDVDEKMNVSQIEPLLIILMSFDCVYDSLKFIFSGESKKIKFKKNLTIFSLEYFYDTPKSVIMSALKDDGFYRIREFKESEYKTVRDYIDVL